MFTERAPAKINLFLHLTGRRPDGYHTLESALAFTDVGDVLHAQPADTLSLRVTGPFAPQLAADEDNLVLRAARMLQQATGTRAGAALTLEKHLPVASGIGGGSADAAACLRLLARLWGLALSLEALQTIARPLGSDVPACVAATSALATNLGERLRPLSIPALHLLLVNPGSPLLTAEVYRAAAPPYRAPLVAIPATLTLDFLRTAHNDLQPPAMALLPQIGGVLSALSAAPGCLLARMSGSGATCFGVFTDAQAARAAQSLFRTRNGYWAYAATAGDTQ